MNANQQICLQRRQRSLILRRNRLITNSQYFQQHPNNKSNQNQARSLETVLATKGHLKAPQTQKKLLRDQKESRLSLPRKLQLQWQTTRKTPKNEV
jgi:hypothetical protein